MPAAQGLSEDHRNQADLSVSDRSYFGADLSNLDGYSAIPISPNDPREPFRHSYVYQAVYSRGDEYGGIQLRARVHTLGPELPEQLHAWLEEAAHRSAYMFDSGIQTQSYGPAPSGTRGTVAGDGYLSGFNAVATYQNHESEAVEDAETQPGVVDWSVEVYLDDDFNYASLSGIAQGVANPYWIEERHVDPEESVDITPTKWEITWNPTKDGGRYDVHPKGNTKARRRYQTGAGRAKTVYINRKPVGSLDQEGRVWLAPKYAGDPNTTSGSWGTYWSREGLVDKTGATYQALSRNGRLYQTGENERAVYLVTAREKPDGWEEGDPDNVSETLEAKAGESGYTIHVLRLRDPGAAGSDGDPIPFECRRDYQRDKHLGLSSPRYSHTLSGNQRWSA